MMHKLFPKKTSFVIVVCAFSVTAFGTAFLAAAEPMPVTSQQLADIRARRDAMLARTRRVWFNHDGCDASNFRTSRLKGDKATPQDLLDVRTTQLADTHVDTLSYCTICSGFSNVTYRTKVGRTFIGPPARENCMNITGDLIEQGTDPLEVMVEFCHDNEMECFWSMRMNDTHDVAWRPETGHRLFPELKEAHPEYLLGSYENKPRLGRWTSVNYAMPEVRELCYRLFEEVCRNYDVDGVELDFFRHMYYFRSVADGGQATDLERQMMTDLLRRIRAMTEREGIRRGRPILMAIRVPDSVDYARAVGLDVQTWLEEGLVDCLIGSGYFRLNHWSHLVDLGHRYGVKVYPCLSESRIRRDADAYRARRSDAGYRARAMSAWQAGADGIYIFNEYNANRQYLHQIGNVDAMRDMSKHYFVTVRNGSPGSYLADGNSYMNRSLISPEDPITLVAGKTRTVQFEFGEDVSWTKDAANISAEITCHLDVQGLDEGERLDVRLNGHDLQGVAASDRGCDIPIDPELLIRGLNTVDVALPRESGVNDDGRPREDESWDHVYSGDHVMRMPTQLPWRRLFKNSSWTEEIREEAFFFADNGTGANEWSNLVYPWAASPGRTAVVEATVKLVSSTDSRAVCVRVANGEAVDYLTIEPEAVRLEFADLAVPMDTTSDFHTYRLALKGQDIRLYVDGRLVANGQGRFTTPADDEEHWLDLTYGKRNWNTCSVLFGSASGSGQGSALWRSVKLRDHAKVWTDLSLSVAYPVAAADVPAWDVVYDGSELPAKPWRGTFFRAATSAEPTDGALLVSDSGTERGDYLHFSHPWNINAEEGGTAEARVKLISGWCSLRCDNGTSTERLLIHPDHIRLHHHGAARYRMDTTDDFHTYRLVVEGQDIRVYVDGKLRIDGAGLYTEPSSAKRNDVAFGSANSPSTGKALWQTVRFARKAY